MHQNKLFVLVYKKTTLESSMHYKKIILTLFMNGIIEKHNLTQLTKEWLA